MCFLCATSDREEPQEPTSSGDVMIVNGEPVQRINKNADGTVTMHFTGREFLALAIMLVQSRG